jgi:gamma-glutamylcyclotransferase
MHYYFAYGSNMNPERVRQRKLPFRDYQFGTLNHYSLVFNKRSTIYPGAASANVQVAPNQTVEGLLYALHDEDSISAMDPFEGYPVRYDRLLLPVVTEKEVVNSWVYIANQEYIEEGLRPASWYLQHLLAGRPLLSESYYQQLAATECLPDSDVEPRR